MPRIRTLGAALAVVSVALLGAAGCGSTGGQSAPVSSPAPAGPPTSAAAQPPASTAPAGPWTAATDPKSGITAQLSGTSLQTSTASGGGTTVRVYFVSLPGGGEQRLNVTDLRAPVPDALAISQQYAQSVHGTVTSNQPVSVDGYPGADFRIQLSLQGQPAVILGRGVYSPTESAQVLTLVPGTDDSALRGVHDQAAGTLSIPPAAR